MNGNLTGGTMESKKPSFRWLFLAVVGVVFLWLVSWFLVGIIADSSNANDTISRGIVGDSFGAVNALFSGLVFAFLTHTLLQQNYQIEQQEREIKQTQKLIEQQEKELKQQNITLQRQSFENTFFQMIELYNKIADNFEYGSRTGVRAAAGFYELLKSRYTDSVRAEGLQVDDITKCTILKKTYKNWYASMEPYVGPYFKMLESIFEFIYESQIENKDFYFKVMVSNLSSAELSLLFYHVTYSGDQDKMQKYICGYNVFESFDMNSFKFICHSNDQQVLVNYQNNSKEYKRKRDLNIL